ncbi:MAG: hypothetical protein HN712_06945 [Gemmatimonadetes bacterium]|jgi:hypothetical protein|nr:hypothetical protein [Gemmatimonadota bacterium]MBT7860031.1 hypothetical protein [Gemmatimonadota bacterium]
MKLVLAVALLTALAFIGSRVSVVGLLLTRIERLAGIRHLLLTGTEFVLVGLVLGSHVGFGVLDPATLTGLAPCFGLGLAWIGLLFGVQWDMRRLPAPTRALLPAALWQATLTGAIVASGTHALLQLVVGWPNDTSLVAALSLGAAAAGTAGVPASIRQADAGLARLLRTIADVDGVIPILTFGLVCCLPLFHAGDTRFWLWLISSIGLGLAVGLVVIVLGSYRLSEDDLLVVLLGAVLLGGGAALFLSLSPLLVNAIAGVLIANVARPRTCSAVRRLLLQGDREVYILFLLLAGALWNPGRLEVLGLALLYVVVRILGKWLAAGWALHRWLPHDQDRRVGLGLVSHDALAVAIAINLRLLVATPMADLVVTVVLVGVIINELVAPLLAVRAMGPGDPEPAA